MEKDRPHQKRRRRGLEVIAPKAIEAITKQKRRLDADAFLVLKIIVVWSLRPGHFDQKAAGQLELEA